jgi:class 3 adenylate cyclase/predicted ATPase
MTFYEVLEQVIVLLQRHGRVSYRALRRQFSLDDELLADLKAELRYARYPVVEDEDLGLVWTGKTAPPSEQTLPSPRPEIGHASPSEQPRAEPRVPEAERRQLTVLFCDLVGSTQLSGRLDPEDLRQVVRAYQEAAAAVIQRFEGHIAQYLGDGLLVYYGYPTAHEDDARRAVFTSLGIVEAMGTLNSRLQADYGVALAVRIGIHTGPVVVGQMGGGGRHEHLALGETPNLAARLQGLAPANAVVISAVTARLVQGTFALEDQGTHALPGVAEPMTVSRVRGLLATLSGDEEFVAAGVPLLVGRDEEAGLLRRRWEQSKAGLGQVVLISGEAGIGKSALVEALRAEVRAEGLPRIAVRCSPYHTHSALYPVITHLEHLLQFEPDDPPATRLAKLEAGLRPSGLPLVEVVPLFAGLLSVPLPAERYPALTLTPQQQKQQTLDALVAWLATEAERQPVLVAWEDLYWADPTTVELLGLVLDQAPTLPMLHVLTYRPEFSPPWPPRSHITPLVLNRLERPQVEALIAQRAGGKTLPAEVVQHIVSKTDGVPLYVEELTKMLLGSVLLREEESQYILTGPLRTVAIPDTLQDALMARLDQLNQAKEVAQLGAVLGREFAYELLQAVAPQDEETLQAGLAQLVGAELLYQRGRPPRARYLFKHALIRDAAYASLLKSTRQQVHQRVAQVLERQFAALVETQPELVAQHYTAADCTEQALVYWQQAGQQASERSAHVEAISHVTTGIELLKTLPETPEHTQQAVTLHIALGASLIATKGQAAPEVEQTYAHARQLCQHLDDPHQFFPVLRGLWNHALVRAEHQTAQALSEQLLALAEQAQEPAMLVAAHRAVGSTLFCLGVPASAYGHLTQGIALHDPQQHRAAAFRYGEDSGVICHSFAAWALWYLGYPDQGLARIGAAVTLAQQSAHPFSLSFVLSFAAVFHQLRREGRATQERAEAAMSLATEQGFSLWAAYSSILRAWALAHQGQPKEGIEQLHQGLTAWRATQAEIHRPYFLMLLAEAYETMGQLEAGLTVLAEALTLVDKSGERWYEPELYRLTGALLLQQSADHHTEAQACFYQALDVARAQQAKSFELRAATSLCRLWQQQGRRDEARVLLAPIYGWFTEGFDTADLREAKALLEELS